MTLVDHAAPARLREVYLRLRARDPATEVIVDVRRLDELPLGATSILALSPSTSEDALDWLNLNRPVLSERRLTVVLWCEDDAAAALSYRAPDFFDWISARVDCPPAPAAHAVAEVKRAICARACGIAWDGPGLEETLAAVRPGRPVRRVGVASYQSMIEALTSREPGWLFVEGIDTEFHLRRLRWAMAETGRRVIVFRPPFDLTMAGWWTVHAMHVAIAKAVHALTAAGGTGRLAALTGLDPDACAYARFALLRGIEAARLEDLLATTSDPRAALQELAWQSGWTAADVISGGDPRGEFAATRRALERQAARHERDDDRVVLALRGQPLESKRWVVLAKLAANAGDYEVETRWLTAALRSLPDDASSLDIANLHFRRGQAHFRARGVAAARADLEQAYSIAQDVGDAPMIAISAAWLASALLEQGEPLRAREYLAIALSAELGNQPEAAILLGTLAMQMEAQGDLAEARRLLERAFSMKGRVADKDPSSVATTSSALGRALEAQGDLAGARSHLAQSLEADERRWGPDHPSVVATLRALARVHWDMGNASDARAYLERALTIQRVALGSDEHPDVADTFVALARMIAAGGDLDGAQAMLERALSTQQKAFGDDGQLAGATTRRALANVLVARGDLVGAIGQLERALATLRRIFERDDHPDIVSMLSELERLRGMQRELERAD